MDIKDITKKNEFDNINHALKIIVGFLEKTGSSDLQSQIDFMEFMNTNFIKTPLFIATINSLKELQTIKRKNNIPH